MFAISAPAPSSVARQVLRVISRRKAIRLKKLRRRSNLMRELHLDLLDLVDIILALEGYFHITIPDEVPFFTVGDLVKFVTAEKLGFGRSYAPAGPSAASGRTDYVGPRDSPIIQ